MEQIKSKDNAEMVVLRVRSSNNKGQQGRNKNLNQKASRPKIEQMGPKESLCGSAAGLNLLVWLKGLALDPFEPEASNVLVQKFQHQTLELREVWRSGTAKYPPRKRKLEQLLEEEKVTGASGLASKNTNYKNVKKLNCQPTVWNSCSSDSVLTFDSSVQWKQFSTDSKASDNTSNWDSLNKDVSSLVEVDELVNGSSLVNSENLIVQDQPLVESSDLISSANSSSSEVKLQQAVRLLITQSDSESESESENLRRAVIPIGPKFQAELPEWMGPVNKGNLYGSDGDLETLKWLGTKIWPIEEVNPRSKMKKIGRGRPDSCSCVSPGSEDCVKCHMLSARHNLQSELGPAFLSWRFNEMGEVVSKTWTTKEQRMFESLAKNYLLSDRTNFWECAFKRFRSKGKRNILNYYYNVFIPRRMSQQTRSSLKEVVDSDEDQVDDDEDEGGDWRRCKYRYNR